MKTHLLVGVSLGIKNLFGLLPYKKKSKFHINIHDILFALSKKFMPDITILDGIVGMDEMGPIFGKAVNANILFASTDTLLLDILATKIMGCDPDSIHYLNMINKERICRESYLENFNRVPTLLYQIIDNVVKQEIDCVDSLVNMMIAPNQTKKYLPGFIADFEAIGILVNQNNKISLNKGNIEKLFQLFPEVKPLLNAQLSDVVEV